MASGPRTRRSFSISQAESTLTNARRYKRPGEAWTDWDQDDYVATLFYEPSASTCNDVVGRFNQDNLLDITHTQTTPGAIDYNFLGSVVERNIGGLIYSEQYRSRLQSPLLPHASWENQDALYTERLVFATEAAAGVNPSGAKFDAAIFLGELRDLPSLFQNAGRTLAKGGANEYLKYQYGWKPLIKDLRNFFRVVNDVDKRLRTLERLKKDDSLRLPYRSKNPVRTEGFEQSEQDGTHYLHTFSSKLKTDVSWTRDRWAIVNFIPEVPANLLSLPSHDQLRLINKALYGGVVDGNTLWQLMPWSWLFDWNLNVSSFLESQRNVVGAKVTDVTVMETTTALVTTDLVGWEDWGGSGESHPTGSGTPGKLYQVSKRRIPKISPAVTSTGEIDLLMYDSFKTSILTALAIQRFK